MPVRIQRKRVKGWRMPEGVVYVGRPTAWGNPFKVGETYGPGVNMGWPVAPTNILPLFEAYCRDTLYLRPHWLNPLKGKDLACWCREGAPCHADVLLRLANK